jgi:eukaryotic-like serine/threonine-protein kinase
VDSKDDKSEEGPFDYAGRTLDADGKLESPAGAAPAPPRLSRIGRPVPPPQELELEVRPKAAPLELEARPVKPEADYVPPPPARAPATVHGGSAAPWLALLVVAALAAAGWYYFLAKPKVPPRAPIAVVVLITSEPTGAQVSVEGSPMGVTPWAADNTWAKGPVNVTLTAPGYRPWTGTFSGGRPARLEAHLQKR